MSDPVRRLNKTPKTNKSLSRDVLVRSNERLEASESEFYVI